MLYLRARYYAPGLGVFTALDPFEGMAGRPMSLNGYSWVEGNVPNAGDPSGMQATAPPIIDWDKFLRDAIEIANKTPSLSPMWETAIKAALLRQGVAATPELITAGLGRLNLAGIAVFAMMPVQQPNGLICNAWDAQLGLCDPVWDNPSTYQSLAPVLPSFLTQWGWFDLGDSCMIMPAPQASIPPYHNPPQVSTQTLTASSNQPQVVRHYTDVASYQSIIDTGLMNPSVPELTAGGPGIYFTSTDGFEHPANGTIGYSRIAIWSTIGAGAGSSMAGMLRKTACYIDVDKRLLSDALPVRFWTIRIMLRSEYIYINQANTPVNVSAAIVTHGSVFLLDPEGNSDEFSRTIGEDFGVDLTETCGRGN